MRRRVNHRHSGVFSMRRARGFTLVELMVAMAIIGLIVAATVPSSVRFYESIQYRQAVRDVITVLASARYAAVHRGVAQDVLINPQTRVLSFNEKVTRLPDGLDLAVHSVRELNRQQEGVIRFYPQGGSSGGGVDVERPGSRGVKISVDWLAGGISQETYVLP
tara:strand:- start:54024 stop:54512 length:489 start_codon:yes stop_codon:yes gene_type:complete